MVLYYDYIDQLCYGTSQSLKEMSCEFTSCTLTCIIIQLLILWPVSKFCRLFNVVKCSCKNEEWMSSPEFKGLLIQAVSVFL